MENQENDLNGELRELFAKHKCDTFAFAYVKQLNEKDFAVSVGLDGVVNRLGYCISKIMQEYNDEIDELEKSYRASKQADEEAKQDGK